MAGCVNILPKDEVILTPSGTPLKARGTLAGTDTLTEITGASITLANSTAYRTLSVIVSSIVDSCFQIISVNNGVEKIEWEGQTGPGQPTVDDTKDIIILTGPTGIQRLFAKGANADTEEVDDLKAMFTILAP